MSSNSIYYVYQYARTDGTPYYIGKGKENRAYEKHSSVPVPKDKSRIVFLQTGMLEEAALLLEVQLIAQYGRKDTGTGILRNLTDGGEGISGYKHTEAARRIISEHMTTNHPRGMLGKTHTPEKCAEWSLSRRGSGNPNYGKQTPSHVRDASSASNKGMVVAVDLYTGVKCRMTKGDFHADPERYAGVKSKRAKERLAQT